MRFSFPKVGETKLDDVFRGLATGLRRLSFLDNFESFEATVTISAATEKQIENGMPGGLIPTRWLIVDHVGNGIIRRGSAQWTKDFVYLKNVSGSSSATVKVVFFA